MTGEPSDWRPVEGFAEVRAGIALVTTLLAALAPQHWATTLVFAAAAVTGVPTLCAGAAAAAWWGAIVGMGTGRFGEGIADGVGLGVFALVAVAVGSGVHRRLRTSAVWVVPTVWAAIVATRQSVIVRHLGAAADIVPDLVVLGLAASAALSTPVSGPASRKALGALAAVGIARFAAIGLWDGSARLHRAALIHAEALVLPSLVGQSRDLDSALLLAVPDSDVAAARLGWKSALNLGWRPNKPASDAVDTAAALDARGRGGEALRMLKRYPRLGPIDFWVAVYEREQGLPDGWRGGMDGVPALNGALDLDWGLVHNGERSTVFRVDRPLRAGLRAHLDAYQGSPTVAVRLDASTRAWVPSGTLDLGLLRAGPHTLTIRYNTDREGPDGDRNVWVDALVAE